MFSIKGKRDESLTQVVLLDSCCFLSETIFNGGDVCNQHNMVVTKQFCGNGLLKMSHTTTFIVLLILSFFE